MTDRTLPVTAILVAGIGMGVAGDQLLRAPGDPGLNFFLLFLGLAASVWSVTQSGAERLGGEASSWLGVGLLFGAALMWRGSGFLRFLTFVAACAAFALPAFRAGRSWVRRAGLLDLGEAVASAGLHAAFGSVRILSRGAWEDIGDGATEGAARGVARTALGGLLLALFPLVVFGSLFMSADRVFASIVGDLVRIDLQALASHLAVSAFLSWLACGYLVGVSRGTRLAVVQRLRPDVPRIRLPEVATALGLVDLLFLGFVVVQFRYLFGGGAWVEVTPGLTYAEYARAGFFQLVAAVALAIPWLLTTHALLPDRSLRTRSVFRGFAGVHLLLLLVVVASAIQRMLVYQEAYGLTEDRVVATAVLVWLTAVVIWFGATVLGDRRDRFAFGGLVGAFALVGALQLLDPAGLVTRHNLDRATESEEVDAEYLASLGADAAPLLVSRLDELAPDQQCVVAGRLLDRWGPERETDWRSFNWSESRARRAVETDLPTLRSLAGRGECG